MGLYQDVVGGMGRIRSEYYANREINGYNVQKDSLVTLRDIERRNGVVLKYETLSHHPGIGMMSRIEIKKNSLLPAKRLSDRELTGLIVDLEGMGYSVHGRDSYNSDQNAGKKKVQFQVSKERDAGAYGSPLSFDNRSAEVFLAENSIGKVDVGDAFDVICDLYGIRSERPVKLIS